MLGVSSSQRPTQGCIPVAGPEPMCPVHLVSGMDFLTKNSDGALGEDFVANVSTTIKSSGGSSLTRSSSTSSGGSSLTVMVAANERFHAEWCPAVLPQAASRHRPRRRQGHPAVLPETGEHRFDEMGTSDSSRGSGCSSSLSRSLDGGFRSRLETVASARFLREFASHCSEDGGSGSAASRTIRARSKRLAPNEWDISIREGEMF